LDWLDAPPGGGIKSLAQSGTRKQNFPSKLTEIDLNKTKEPTHDKADMVGIGLRAVAGMERMEPADS